MKVCTKCGVEKDDGEFGYTRACYKASVCRYCDNNVEGRIRKLKRRLSKMSAPIYNRAEIDDVEDALNILLIKQERHRAAAGIAECDFCRGVFPLSKCVLQTGNFRIWERPYIYYYCVECFAQMEELEEEIEEERLIHADFMVAKRNLLKQKFPLEYLNMHPELVEIKHLILKTKRTLKNLKYDNENSHT